MTFLGSATSTASETFVVFFFNLHRGYSNSLTLSTAGELSWSWNPQFRNRKKSRRLVTSSIKREIKRFYVVVVQWWQKERTRKCATLAKLLFCMLSWRGCRHTLFVSDAPCKRFYFVLGWAVSIPSNVNWQHDRAGSMPADLRILAHASGSETSMRWGTIWMKRTYFN